MTRLRHTNLVNALFYLPRPAVVLVPLLLKGLTLIVTLGVTAWLRSTWVDLCVLAAVIGYTLLRWSALRYALDGEVLRIREGIWFWKTTCPFRPDPDLGGGIGAAFSAAALRGVSH